MNQLLDRGDIDPSQVKNGGVYPLHMAIEKGDEAVGVVLKIL